MPAKKRSWGICFRYMAACRYILFTLLPPLPLIPPHSLIYGFPSPVFFTILFESRVTSILARLSGYRAYSFHVILSEKEARSEGKSMHAVIPFPYPTSSATVTYSYYGDWRFHEETSFVFVQLRSKVAFLRAVINSGFLRRNVSYVFFFFFFHANGE